jgi:ADP-heptose:LPS heptosyltransferase
VRRYAELARILLTQRITPVILGTGAENALALEIRDTVPDAIDLTNRTALPDLASLARAACLAVGNDTGPMHLIAAAGCPSVVLFSRESDPALTAPRGPQVSVLRQSDLTELDLAQVLAALTTLAALPPPAAPATPITFAEPPTPAVPPSG